LLQTVLKAIEAKSLEEDLAAANPDEMSEEALRELVYMCIYLHNLL